MVFVTCDKDYFNKELACILATIGVVPNETTSGSNEDRQWGGSINSRRPKKIHKTKWSPILKTRNSRKLGRMTRKDLKDDFAAGYSELVFQICHTQHTSCHMTWNRWHIHGHLSGYGADHIHSNDHVHATYFRHTKCEQRSHKRPISAERTSGRYACNTGCRSSSEVDSGAGSNSLSRSWVLTETWIVGAAKSGIWDYATAVAVVVFDTDKWVDNTVLDVARMHRQLVPFRCCCSCFFWSGCNCCCCCSTVYVELNKKFRSTSAHQKHSSKAWKTQAQPQVLPESLAQSCNPSMRVTDRSCAHSTATVIWCRSHWIGSSQRFASFWCWLPDVAVNFSLTFAQWLPQMHIFYTHV